jgi:hypothetical protein
MRQQSPQEQHDEEPLRWHYPRQWKPHTPQILSVKALSLTEVGLELVAECVHRSTKLKSLKDVETLARFVFDGLPPNLGVHVLRFETKTGEVIFQRTIFDLFRELTGENDDHGRIRRRCLRPANRSSVAARLRACPYFEPLNSEESPTPTKQGGPDQ